MAAPRLANIIPAFVGVMESEGYRRSSDAFDPINIPETILDRTFWLSAAFTDEIKTNQADLELQMDIIVRFYVKGYNNPIEALDAGIARSEQLILKFLEPGFRYANQAFRNVVLDSMQPVPLTATTDHSIVIEMRFIVETNLTP